jgi:hypothetical protein
MVYIVLALPLDRGNKKLKKSVTHQIAPSRAGGLFFNPYSQQIPQLINTITNINKFCEKTTFFTKK